MIAVAPPSLGLVLASCRGARYPATAKWFHVTGITPSPLPAPGESAMPARQAISQQTNIHTAFPNALKVLVLRGDGQFVYRATEN